MTSGRCVALALALGGLLPTVALAQRPDAAEMERRLQEELKAPRPIEAGSSVWLEELTWMEVRDALAAGTRTVIIPTGGIEQNGPYLALGKHNYVLQGACAGIASRTSACVGVSAGGRSAAARTWAWYAISVGPAT